MRLVSPWSRGRTARRYDAAYRTAWNRGFHQRLENAHDKIWWCPRSSVPWSLGKLQRSAELRPEHVRSRRRNDTVYVPRSSPVSPIPSTHIERDGSGGDGGGSGGGGGGVDDEDDDDENDDNEDDDGGDGDGVVVMMRIFHATWYNRVGVQSETSSSSSRESVKTARIESIV